MNSQIITEMRDINRMKSCPFLLLPQDGKMVSAKLSRNSIKLLYETRFPSGGKYYITPEGIAVCLTEGKIRYGVFSVDGILENVTVLKSATPFCSSITAVCIYKNHIIIGGSHQSKPVVLAHDLHKKVINKLDMPKLDRIKKERTIDDFFISGNIVTAVDNVAFPKYLIEYDFSHTETIRFANVHKLPETGVGYKILKGSSNGKYVALRSNKGGAYHRHSKNIEIFSLGDYSDHKAYLTNDRPKIWGSPSECDWYDILLVKEDYLLISAGLDGVGIYDIEAEGEVKYYNPWDRKLIKILKAPLLKYKLALIFEEKEKSYSYEVSSLKEIQKGKMKDVNAGIEGVQFRTYGICEECGEEISALRLKILPATTLCIDCKNAQELKSSPFVEKDSKEIEEIS